jgi:predicted nucleotidyltransferase
MRSESSKTDGAEAADPAGTTIELALPIREPALFKHGATPHVLNFLADNPDVAVSLRQLASVVPYTERATREAVDVLEANGLVATDPDGTARRVRIDRRRLRKADDPVLAIPQPEFQLPARLATLALESELDGVRGIVLFGSVARGEADRRSDVDLWVLVEGDAPGNQHAANRVADELSDRPIPPTLALSSADDADGEPDWAALAEHLGRGDPADGERYSFEIVVESPRSFLQQLHRVDAGIFTEGITLRDSETLRRLKREVLDRE